MADIAPPIFKRFERPLQYPGSSDSVSVLAYVTDDSVTNTTLYYGYNNSTWSSVTTNRTGNPITTYTDRNPNSGYGYNTVLYQEYDLGGAELAYLNVYIYSADHDTCYIRVRGWNNTTSSWDTIKYVSGTSTSHRDGTMVDDTFFGKHYTKFDIRYEDTEDNDNIYYNITYRAGLYTFNGSIPAAGTNDHVYYYFNATDSSGNSRESPVFDYTIDTKAPLIQNFTMPASTRHDAVQMPIHANISDDSGVKTAYLNWSADSWTTTNTVNMSLISGTTKSGQYRTYLPAPPGTKNTTVHILVGATDVVGQHNNTTSHNFTWNPSPWIENVSHAPVNPNDVVKVNVSADVYDGDGVSNVSFKYSTNGGSTWTKVASAGSSGSRYWAILDANLGSPWVHYKVWANDTKGGSNETTASKYYVDKVKPRIFTPQTEPSYANATTAIYASANITDSVGIAKAVLKYSMDNGATWNTSVMSKASDADNLTVAGYKRSSTSSYWPGIPAIGSAMGTWNSTLSGYGGTPSAALFTDVDCIILDGESSSFYVNDAITAARAGRFVIVDYSTWSSIRSTLSSPSYTSHVSHGFTTYGFNLGRGAVVMTNSLMNRNYLGYSYGNYNSTVQANLAEHLLGAHRAFMPYGGQIPATGSTCRVLFKINATDNSNLSIESGLYEYTTDGTSPTFSSVRTPPSPAGYDQTDNYDVWAAVSDETYLGGVMIHYSLDGGSTWSYKEMTRSTGNNTVANYTSYIPYTSSSTWVNYYYEAYDRAHNTARNPASTVYAYRTSDAPVFSNVVNVPTAGNKNTNVTVTATIIDADVVAEAKLYYRYGTSLGPYTVVNCTAGTNDRWSASIPPPSDDTITTVRYYVSARDTIGVWAYSSTYSYDVDSHVPSAVIDDWDPDHPDENTAVTVSGRVWDDKANVKRRFEYKYGETGTVNADEASVTYYGETSARYPSSGSTRYGSYRYYYMNDQLGDLYLWVYSSGTHNYVRVTAYNQSSYNWETLHYNTYTPEGVVINQSYFGRDYDRIRVEVDAYGYYETYYWIVKYTDGNPHVNVTIPAPGYSTWVYFRLKAIDNANNINTTQWYKYFADGRAPTLSAHTSPSVQDAGSPVTITASFVDEYSIDRVVLYYSFGGSFKSVAMTATTSNSTHLRASGSIKATLLPITVRYYFVMYDKAGNSGQTSAYTYDTALSAVDEGVLKVFDATNLFTAAGYKAWSWDYDYTGTFVQDASGIKADHAYMDDGDYTIALRLTDNNDVVSTMTFAQKVLDLGPTARIGYGPTIPYEGENITLDGASSLSYPDTISTYEWDLDYDGVTFDADATGPNHTILFMDNGTYTVALRVIDDDGSVSIASRVITVGDLKPDIVLVHPNMVDEGQEFTFNATGTTSWPDALDRFEWDFDYDGNFNVDATGNLTDHTYMDHGWYTFQLRVYDEDGSYNSLTRQIGVRDLRPVANISLPATVEEGTEFQANGSGSTSYPDAIILYEWDFLYDGSFNRDATGVTANHTYMDDGNYTIALRVRDDDNSHHLATMTITVTDRAPVAHIQAPVVVDEGATFTVNASNSTSFPDELVGVEWDLDYDGETFRRDALGPVQETVYMDDGTYTIALRLTDDDGSEVIATVTVVVNDLVPVAEFEVSSLFQEGSRLVLDASNSNSWPDEMVSWEWDSDYDGTTFDVEATGEWSNLTYMDDGNFTLALRVTDDDGSQTISTLVVNITDLAPMPITRVTEVIEEGASIVLDLTDYFDSYPDDIVDYQVWWDEAGEFELDEDNVTLRGHFTAPGWYNVSFRATDEDGSVTDSVHAFGVVNVAPQAVIDAPMTPEGDPVVLNATRSIEPGWDLVLFRWDLDDDGVWDVETKNATIEHIWTMPGSYKVSVEVWDEDGTSDTADTFALVTDVAPVPDAGGPYTVDEGEMLTLYGNASYEPGDHIIFYMWDLDDDGIYDVEGMYPITKGSWDIAGTHVVTLTVEDTEGNTVTTTVNVTVLDLDPVFDLHMPVDVEEGEGAVFSVTDLRDPGTMVFQVIWYFGDGEHAAGEVVTHAYAEDGAYMGRLTILDNDGIMHEFPFPGELMVANADPVFRMDSQRYDVVEDEPFSLQLVADDTRNDTLTFDLEGPGGDIDPQTGLFTWTPLDKDVGDNRFTFIVADEDGGRSEVEVILAVEDVDNDFLGGMSTAGGSAIIILLILVVILIAVLYMRSRGSGPFGGEVEPVDGTEEPEVDVLGSIPPEDIDLAMEVAAEAAEAPAAAGTYAYADAAATTEATSEDTAQVPPPPPPPPASGPEFNQLLEDRESESELQGDDETEMDGESEWEVID